MYHADNREPKSRLDGKPLDSIFDIFDIILFLFPPNADMLMDIQAHFWEGLAWNKADTWNKDDEENLQDYVIGALLGNGKNMDYIDPIDWSLFNDDCDGTRVIWMTPAYMDTETSPANYPLYQNKIGKVEDVIAKHLPNVVDNGKLDSETFLYQRLMYNYNGGNPTGRDAKHIDKGAYGQTLFQ